MSDLPPCETDSFDRCFDRAVGLPITWRLLAAAGVIALLAFSAAHARDLDGRYAQSPMHDWISTLHTPGGGLCCSMADGAGVEDVNWDTSQGHYRVRLEDEWIDVPDDKVVKEPNRLGRAMVWTYRMDGKLHVRCFMPGSMT